jgi:hypothetical protein
MKKILLILIILICIGGIVGAAYTYNKYSDSLMNDDTEEPTQKPTEDPSTCKHTKDVVLPAVEATCYKSGYTEGRMCSDCGTMLIEQEVVVKLPHTPEIIPSEQSTCIAHGHGAGSKCSVCHEVLVTPEELPLADHTPYTVPETRSTCIEQGTSSYYKCSVCKTNITSPSRLPLSEHDFSGFIEGAEATCTTNGFSSVHYCIFCGTNESEIITYPALGHLEFEVHPATEPTCTSVGYTAEIGCDRCGYTIQAREEIPMTEHTRVEIAGKASTCAEAGYTAGYKCGECGTVLVEQEPLPMIAHTYVSMETVVADCDTRGRVGGTECSECGAIGTSPTYSPSLGHYYGEKFTAKCDRCGSYYVLANNLEFTLNDRGNYSVSSIGTCDHESIIIPATRSNCNIDEIKSGAIQSDDVETILVGSNVRIIYSEAIKNCPNLKAVFITASVTHTSLRMFSNCPNLTDIYLQFKEGYLPETWDPLWTVGLPEGCTIHYLPEDAVLYGFNYELNSAGNGYAVTGLAYDNSQDHIFHIPAKHNGLPVTEIADGAFKSKYGIYEIYIPNSVTTIGDSAFEWCYDLTKVIFNGDIKLGERAFASCHKLQTVNTVKVIEMGSYAFMATGLKVVELSAKLAVISQYAFDSCDQLTSVYINEGTTTILDRAFYYCSALTNIYLPDGLEHIGVGVFARCNSLESIYIPESVIVMGKNISGTVTGNVFYTTGTLVINCGADSQPSGWYDGWNVSQTDPDTDEILARHTTNWGQAR